MDSQSLLNDGIVVSILNRFSRVFLRYWIAHLVTYPEQFQSLTGFRGFFYTATIGAKTSCTSPFQSLTGFRGFFYFDLDDLVFQFHDRFQSLTGFRGFFYVRWQRWRRPAVWVSILNRFSRVFLHNIDNQIGSNGIGFQSLTGFRGFFYPAQN